MPIFPSSLFAGRAPDGWRSFTCFVGGATDPERSTLDDERVSWSSLPAIQTAVGARGTPRVLCRSTRWTHAIPQYTVGHPARVAEIEAGGRGGAGTASPETRCTACQRRRLRPRRVPCDREIVERPASPAAGNSRARAKRVIERRRSFRDPPPRARPDFGRWCLVAANERTSKRADVPTRRRSRGCPRRAASRPRRPAAPRDRRRRIERRLTSTSDVTCPTRARRPRGRAASSRRHAEPVAADARASRSRRRNRAPDRPRSRKTLPGTRSTPSSRRSRSSATGASSRRSRPRAASARERRRDETAPLV